MSDQDDVRRLRVASLFLRGLLPVEIQGALRQNGVACELAQVCDDVAFLQRVWATEVALEKERHLARILAELREARRSAWAAGDFDLVMRGLEQEERLIEKMSGGAVEMLKL